MSSRRQASNCKDRRRGGRASPAVAPRRVVDVAAHTSALQIRFLNDHMPPIITIIVLIVAEARLASQPTNGSSCDPRGSHARPHASVPFCGRSAIAEAPSGSTLTCVPGICGRPALRVRRVAMAVARSCDPMALTRLPSLRRPPASAPWLRRLGSKHSWTQAACALCTPTATMLPHAVPPTGPACWTPAAAVPGCELVVRTTLPHLPRASLVVLACRPAHKPAVGCVCDGNRHLHTMYSDWTPGISTGSSDRFDMDADDHLPPAKRVEQRRAPGDHLCSALAQRQCMRNTPHSLHPGHILVRATTLMGGQMHGFTDVLHWGRVHHH